MSKVHHCTFYGQYVRYFEHYAVLAKLSPMVAVLLPPPFPPWWRPMEATFFDALLRTPYSST